jgi:hypothetical protein
MRNQAWIFVPLIVSAIGFMGIARNPHFEVFRAVDIVQLLACGMCLGIALMAALGRLKPR